MTTLVYPSPLSPTVSGGDASFLRGFAFSVRWTPQFFNQTRTAQSGAAVTIGLAQYPLHQFELTYSILADFPGGTYAAANYEFRRLLGFYSQMQGSLGRFFFLNPDDFTVTDQFLGTGDGTTTTFVITRDIGDPVLSTGIGREPIGGIMSGLAGNPTVKINGSVTAAYTIQQSPANNTITFSSPPAPSAALTITLPFFYYYCRFVEDSLLLEKFSGNRWQAASVKLQSCRPGF